MIRLDYKGVIVAAVVGGVAVWFLGKGIKAIAPDVVAAVDPTNDQNIFNKGFEKVAEQTTGSKDVGGDLYDATHNEDSTVPWYYAPVALLDQVTGLPNKGISF